LTWIAPSAAQVKGYGYTVSQKYEAPASTASVYKGTAIVKYGDAATTYSTPLLFVDSGTAKIQLVQHAAGTANPLTNTVMVSLETTGLAIKKGGDISLEYDASNPAQIKFMSGATLRHSITFNASYNEGLSIGVAGRRIILYDDSSTDTILFSSELVNCDADLTISGDIGFYGKAPQAKPAVTGSRGSNAALASLCTALAGLGLITNSTT
jgi:hypothetical protein